MKLRLLLMGCIVSTLSLILIGLRGFAVSYEGLLGVGVVLLVLGMFWK